MGERRCAYVVELLPFLKKWTMFLSNSTNTPTVSPVVYVWPVEGVVLEL